MTEKGNLGVAPVYILLLMLLVYIDRFYRDIFLKESLSFSFIKLLNVLSALSLYSLQGYILRAFVACHCLVFFFISEAFSQKSADKSFKLIYSCTITYCSELSHPDSHVLDHTADVVCMNILYGNHVQKIHMYNYFYSLYPMTRCKLQ